MSNWLTYSPTSGVGNGTITITADTLSELEDRVATLVAKSQSSSDLSATTVVLQRGTPPTSITFNSLTWVSDVSYRGGTASSANCDYVIYANYADGRSEDITSDATISGSITIPLSMDIERHSAGTLTLTATYDNLYTTSSVTAYQEASPLAEYLTFNIITGGTIAWKIDYAWADDYPTIGKKTIEYKLNDGEWISITSNTGDSAPTINVVAGDVVYFRGDNEAYGYDEETLAYFNKFSTNSSTRIDIRGNIMSLIDSTGFTSATTLTSAYTFTALFENCGVRSCENLVLPATTLAQDCYNGMFSDCRSLTTAPSILPATTLARSCYDGMFFYCTSLTTAPELPATTLAERCYSGMFRECHSLTTAPVLPATTLASECYRGMFYGCQSLKTAPELPATTLAPYCYNYMFSYCTGLITAPSILPATTLTPYCYYYMFRNCNLLTTAPELPATILVDSCYEYMFYYCTSLNYIKCLATDISANRCIAYWVAVVPEDGGTFVKNPNMTGWTTGWNGIPRLWTIQDAT